MAAERYRHLFLEGPTQTPGFTSPSQGGGSEKIHPDRNPPQHSERLVERLDEAWEEAEERQAAVHSTRQGCYIEFASSPGADLALKSLEDIRGGIRLLNVRTRGEGSSTETLATVFVPSEKRNHFLKKIRDYGDPTKNTEIKGNPKHQDLVAPIEDIAAALLQDFWTDQGKSVPGQEPKWVEVWLSTEQEDLIEDFRALLEALEIQEHEDHPILQFPERMVLLILANGKQLADLIEHSDLIAEFREAREVATFFLELENQDQAEWCENLLARLEVQEESGVVICILDHGVNQGHPLIEPLLATDDLHSVKEEWGTADDHGHGTLMAGVAGYKDLQEALESGETVVIAHRLESSKILPPPPAENPEHLWGYVTAQGISRVEIEAPERKRVICLAITATKTRDLGHPTSWSAELDNLTSGSDESEQRLIVVSAGNVVENWNNYPDENLTNEVNDPAQSWNALSVGACTFKTAITSPDYEGYHAIAKSGELSPYSATSRLWEHEKWPIKPEIVVEGGNVA